VLHEYIYLNLLPSHGVQTCSEPQQTSYLMDTGVTFPPVYSDENVTLNTHSHPVRKNYVQFNLTSTVPLQGVVLKQRDNFAFNLVFH